MVLSTTEYIFADLESYTASRLKYSYFYQHYAATKAYAILGKGYNTDFYSFEVDLETWLIDIIFNTTSNREVFFHNLKFDGQFILPIMIKLINDGVLKEKNFSYFIDGKKNIFSIKYKFTKKKKTYKIVFRDSYKIWPLSLKNMGKAVGLKKLDYDYDIQQTFNTKEDFIKFGNGKPFKYLQRDVDIPIAFGKATEGIVGLSKYKSTLASTALSLFMETNELFKKNMKYWFYDDVDENNEVIERPGLPTKLATWGIVQMAYQGGFTYVNPMRQKKLLYQIYVYDINSLYPSVMLNMSMPFGKACYNELNEKYSYKFYMVNIEYARAEIPFIGKEIDPNDYLNIDLDNQEEKEQQEIEYSQVIKNQIHFMDNYKLASFEKYYKGKWEKTYLCSFREKKGFFNEYINYFKAIKENADIEGNEAVRQLAKLFLNSLYGKFGQKIKGEITRILRDLEPIKDKIRITEKQTLYQDGVRLTRVIKNDTFFMVKMWDKLARFPKFIAMSCSITSQARCILVDAIYKNKDSFVYCDTDSIHLTKPAIGITIHKTNFGDWKFEGKWDKAIYRRAKHYYHLNDAYKFNFKGTEKEMEYNDKEYELKGGGFKVNLFNPNNLNFEEYLQSTFVVKDGKLLPFIVKGGIVLIPGSYKFNMPKWYIEK